MAMSSKHRLTSGDDIEFARGCQILYGTQTSAIENIKTKHPCDPVHGTELKINLLCVSLLL